MGDNDEMCEQCDDEIEDGESDDDEDDWWGHKDLDLFHEDTPTSTGARAPRNPPPSAPAPRAVPVARVPSSGQGVVGALARAIQHHEGWIPPSTGYPKGSRAFRNNNPGNLRYAGQPGATGRDSSGFAIFPDYPTGWDALLRDLRAKLGRNPSLTIRSLLNVYAPPSENDTGAYINAVADELGMSADAPLA